MDNIIALLLALAQVVLATGPLATIGIVATTTAMACLAGIRMMIMIFKKKFAYL